MKKLLTIFFILIAFISEAQIKIHDLPPAPNKDSTEFIVSKIVSSVWHSYKIPIDSIQSRCYQLTVHDDSVIRWCTCDTCIDMTVKGGSQLVAECARGMDTAYKINDSTIRFCRQDQCWELSLKGTGVDSIWRVPGIDSFYWSKLGVTYSVLDSTGEFKQEIVNSQDIYHENVEWPTSTNVGNIDPASPTLPCSGSVSIEGTTVGEGDYIAFTPASMPTLADYNYLVFKISSKGHWNPGQRLRLRWINGSTPIGVGVYFADGSYGFKSSLTDSCQLMYVPMAAFGDISAATSFRIVGSINSSGTIGYFIDDIVIIQSNINPIISTAQTWDQVMRNSPDISQDYFSHFNSSIWTMDSILQLNIHVTNWVDIIGDKDAGREDMLKMHVNDGGKSVMSFSNSTITNGAYSPLIAFYRDPKGVPSDNGSGSFRALVDTLMDYAGATDPAFSIIGAVTHDADHPNAPPLFDLQYRPLFGFGNATFYSLLGLPSGQLQFPMYVPGAFTGTPVHGLAVDALGNVIVTDTSSGGGGGTNDRFGLEDVTAGEDRTFHTVDHNFVLDADDVSTFLFGHNQIYIQSNIDATAQQKAALDFYGDGTVSLGGYDNTAGTNADVLYNMGDLIMQASDNPNSHQHVLYMSPTLIEMYTFNGLQNLALQLDNLPAGNSSTDDVLTIDPATSQVRKISMISWGITSETDAIALAKTITENDGYGLIETQTATQALSTNPSWTRRIDTFAIETRERGLKIIDSLHSIISTGISATAPITYSGGVISTSMSTNKLIGRATSGTGVMEEITLGTNLSLSGSTLNATGGSSSTGANPTASVGLSVVNGSAATFMRSDASPPIDQTINPVWTGSHEFRKDNLTTTQVANVQLTNTTLATTGVRIQNSPGLYFKTSNWNTASSAANTDEWMSYIVPITAGFNQSKMSWFFKPQGGGFNELMNLSNANGGATGTLTVTGAITASGGGGGSIVTGTAGSYTWLQGGLNIDQSGSQTNATLSGFFNGAGNLQNLVLQNGFSSTVTANKGLLLLNRSGVNYGVSPWRVSTTSGSATITGNGATGQDFRSTFKPGDQITINGETKIILSIATGTSMTATTNFTNTNTNIAYTITASNQFIFRENGQLGMGNASPDYSSVLDITSTTQGFLPPRMTTTQRDAIVSPAEGLEIYNTTLHKHQGFDGTTWNSFY